MTCFDKLSMTCFDKLSMTCFDKLSMTDFIYFLNSLFILEQNILPQISAYAA